MKIGHSYTTNCLAVCENFGIGKVIVGGNELQDRGSFLVIESRAMEFIERWVGYKVLGPGFIGWIAIKKNIDEELDLMGRVVGQVLLHSHNHFIKEVKFNIKRQ